MGADHAIAAVHKELANNIRKSSIAPDVLMLVARAFARAELDPGRSLQEAMMSAMEAQAKREVALQKAADAYCAQVLATGTTGNETG